MGMTDEEKLCSCRTSNTSVCITDCLHECNVCKKMIHSSNLDAHSKDCPGGFPDKFLKPENRQN